MKSDDVIRKAVIALMIGCCLFAIYTFFTQEATLENINNKVNLLIGLVIYYAFMSYYDKRK